MATYKIWTDLMYNLIDVHGRREAPVPDITELIKLVEAVEEKYLTFALISDDAKVPEPPPNRETREGDLPRA